VTCGVIRRLQTVDIHVHGDQASIAATSSGDLLFELFQSRSALPGSGERVERGGVALSRRLSTVARRQLAVLGGMEPIERRLDAVYRRPLTVGLRAFPITARSQDDLLARNCGLGAIAGDQSSEVGVPLDSLKITRVGRRIAL
jgi:hypothetical protein